MGAMGAELAAEAEDFKLALQCLGRLGERFDLDAVRLQCELLTRETNQPRTAPGNASLAAACVAAGFQAVALDEYDRAQALARLARPAAAASGQGWLGWQAGFLESETARCQTEYERARPLLEESRRQPGAARASVAAGGFLCFAKNDWETGLPLMGAPRRAYSRGLCESVTRGDRRRRELWFGRPSPPLASPRE